MTASRLGDYEVIREIGHGGMGRVFLAKNVHVPAMVVVLKVLMDPAQKARFLREAEIYSKLDHRNICQIRTFFVHDDDLVIAMQFVEGKTLAEKLAADGSLDLNLVKKVFLQVLDGIGYAHSKYVYHLDLKPDNIMVDELGQVKIIDFGISRQTHDVKLTATGQAVGTPLYMSPEQFVETEVSDLWLCDIYALGISLFEVCCGEPPFQSTNPYILKEMHCGRKPPRPTSMNSNVSPELEEVILKAIAKKPGSRFRSAQEMRDAIERIDSMSLGAGETERFRKRHTTNRWLRIGAAVLLVSALVSALVLWPRPHRHLAFSVPSQEVNKGQPFVPIELGALLPPNQAIFVKHWSSSGSHELSVEIAGNGTATFRKPSSSWTGRVSIWLVAEQQDGTRDSASATFACKPRELRLSPLPTYQFRAGAEQVIHLASLIEEPSIGDSTITWTTKVSEGLRVKLNGRIATVTSSPTWRGPGGVTLTASNSDGVSASVLARFELAPQPEASLPPVTKYAMRLRVLPQTGIIYDTTGNQYLGRMNASVPEGVYHYKVLHPKYPITEVTVSVTSRDMDTTVDLSNMYIAPSNARLGVAIIDTNGEPIDRKIRLNSSQTDYVSTQGTMMLIPGKYQISFDRSQNLHVDSVQVDDLRNDAQEPEVTLKSSQMVRVYFFVSGQSGGN